MFSVASLKSIDREAAEYTIFAVATEQSSNSTIVIEPQSGRLTWTALEGQWQVQVVEQQYRTPATRSVNNPRGGNAQAIL